MSITPYDRHFYNREDFFNAARSALMPLPTITSPTVGETGVSLTPSIVTKEGISKIYALLTRITSDQTLLGLNSDIIFNHMSDDDLDYNDVTGVVTLQAGYEYELTANPNLTNFSGASSYARYQWVYASDNTPLPNGQAGSVAPNSNASDTGNQQTAAAVIRVSVDTDVKLRIIDAVGTCSLASDNSWGRVQATTSRFIDYTGTGVEVQVRNAETRALLESCFEPASLTCDISTVLPASTECQVRCRHMTLDDFHTGWTPWQNFTTGT